MELSFNIKAFSGRLPDMPSKDDFCAWARGERELDISAKPGKLVNLPMMIARRMCPGSRMAVDTALELLKEFNPDGCIFSSMHGELEKNYNILKAIVADADVSPTDFAMSVHNSASGNFTIVGKCTRAVSSVCAGLGTFMQALTDAVALLEECQHVLIVDFDSYIPEFFRQRMHYKIPSMAYAVGLVIGRGDDFKVKRVALSEQSKAATFPFSLCLARDLLIGDKKELTLHDETCDWEIKRK